MTPTIGEPPVGRRKAVAAYVFAAMMGAFGSGLAANTGHDYGAAATFGLLSVVMGGIAVLVGGPPPS